MDFELARELFIYNREIGELRWFSDPEVEAGARTHLAGLAYRAVKYKGKRYKVHRVIWLLETGSWPEGSVDHIDRNGENNRFSNLRLASHSQNMINRKLQKNNTSGYRGVCWCIKRGKPVWQASIKIGGKKRTIGTFKTKEEAAKAYRSAAEKLFGEFMPTGSLDETGVIGERNGI